MKVKISKETKGVAITKVKTTFKPTNLETSGTCASPVEYPRATADMLKQLFGEPVFDLANYNGFSDEKVNYEWEFIGEDGSKWTLYDYKEGYIQDDQLVRWHVGWDGRGDADAFQEYLHGMINKYFGEEIAELNRQSEERLRKFYKDNEGVVL